MSRNRNWKNLGLHELLRAQLNVPNIFDICRTPRFIWCFQTARWWRRIKYLADPLRAGSYSSQRWKDQKPCQKNVLMDRKIVWGGTVSKAKLKNQHKGSKKSVLRYLATAIHISLMYMLDKSQSLFFYHGERTNSKMKGRFKSIKSEASRVRRQSPKFISTKQK